MSENVDGVTRASIRRLLGYRHEAEPQVARAPFVWPVLCTCVATSALVWLVGVAVEIASTTWGRNGSDDAAVLVLLRVPVAAALSVAMLLLPWIRCRERLFCGRVPASKFLIVTSGGLYLGWLFRRRVDWWQITSLQREETRWTARWRGGSVWFDPRLDETQGLRAVLDSTQWARTIGRTLPDDPANDLPHGALSRTADAAQAPADTGLSHWPPMHKR